MDIIAIIHKRRSVRTYQTRKVPDELLRRAADAFEKAQRLNDVPLRLLIVPAERIARGMTGLVGSYGSMVNPPHYAVGISAEGKGDQVNFGFVMEQFILACTREGLGTCWVGGFFKKSLVEQAIPLESGERIICVSPLGYAEERRFAERTMRTLGGLNARRPLSERVFDGHWGRPADEYLAVHPVMRNVFEAARWAPSASNRQPVHYVLQEDMIVASVLTTLHSKYMALLGGSDRSENLDFQDVDAGIGMAHIHLAAAQLGVIGRWSVDIDEPSLRAKFGFPAEARIIGEYRFKPLK